MVIDNDHVHSRFFQCINFDSGVCAAIDGDEEVRFAVFFETSGDSCEA